ncbi:ankyrin repeat domain-containing protein [Sansalvadorimonas verongulae]|uniref:ankyrin repeat domain-containing protein n=1 Tax=Sansalvadorimonas verongulae TaxID=2172824 RepID=UPI0012BC5D7F|nr:ankyrin repeat domain-containing protein [Sansalvadorimonas verongulae]MTI13959.1 hypothetical protein [Sansalvadorimonas verongulae]
MLRVHKKQQWIYASFFFFVFGFCSNALAKGECEAALSEDLNREYDEHDFLAACRVGNVEAVHYFVDQVDFDVNEQFISGVSGILTQGLFVAAQNGHAGVVQILVNTSEIDINKTCNRATPLFQAAQNGHAKVVLILLAADANPFTKWRHDVLFTKSPLSTAKQNRPFYRGKNPALYDRYTIIINALKEATRKPKAYKPVETHCPTEETPLLEEISGLRLHKNSK